MREDEPRQRNRVSDFFASCRASSHARGASLSRGMSSATNPMSFASFADSTCPLRHAFLRAYQADHDRSLRELP